MNFKPDPSDWTVAQTSDYRLHAWAPNESTKYVVTEDRAMRITAEIDCGLGLQTVGARRFKTVAGAKACCLEHFKIRSAL